ncbi:hypothetical protein BD324DRAFT_628132 [Kockovaella imperatae]|uniref:Uncharacterized protein n=1 Tax=Kockovaella imperatae TaxID=4999 RepID=A0A1Y1UGS8_9TREE|nr:hypothetical protein BD324DRAFT_628132 [Kockovaella imperatae]ORX36275.1 hypothetical protein BD324DRAFT_628132 [Kockovaella imperatae]
MSQGTTTCIDLETSAHVVLMTLGQPTLSTIPSLVTITPLVSALKALGQDIGNHWGQVLLIWTTGLHRRQVHLIRTFWLDDKEPSKMNPTGNPTTKSPGTKRRPGTKRSPGTKPVWIQVQATNFSDSVSLTGEKSLSTKHDGLDVIGGRR